MCRTNSSGSEGINPFERAGGVSWLFVPGDRPDRFPKATASGADQVICDLEDAVAEDAKDTARDVVARHLRKQGSGSWVRINAAGTSSHRRDLEALAGLPGLSGVVVPKAESPQGLAEVRTALGDRVGLMALVESAIGVLNAPAIAAGGAVDRLAFGALDFALDIAAEHEEPSALLLARSTLVLASRTAGLLGPVDGVTPDVRDTAKAVADAEYGRRLGFGGKLCIHPSQIGPVAEAFTPSTSEVFWANEVVTLAVAAAKGAAVTARGQMIDRPVLVRAQRILALSARSSRPDPATFAHQEQASVGPHEGETHAAP